MTIGLRALPSCAGGGMGLMMGAVMAGFSSNAMNYQPVEGVKMGQAVRSAANGVTFASICGAAQQALDRQPAACPS